MFISFCLDLIVSENDVVNMNKGEKSWILCGGGWWRQAAEMRRGMDVCTLRANPPCKTVILTETKKSETILNLKSELLPESTQLGQVYKLRPAYYSPKYWKIIYRDSKQLNQCIVCVFLAKVFIKTLKAIFNCLIKEEFVKWYPGYF